MEEQGFASALLQDLHDELMARVNKTYAVGDPSDDELNDGEDVERLGAEARARAGGGFDAVTIARRTLIFIWPSGVIM